MAADAISTNPVSRCLREGTARIVTRWETRVRAEVDGVERLKRSALIDHLPEVIEGLASWVEGDAEAARRGFDALAEGHALQRLGFAIDLDTLTLEYSVLRRVILEELLLVESTPEARRSLIDCNEAIDHAVLGAVRRYSARRDHIRERFIGILGHDLRNPLNAIVMASGLLKKKGALDAGDQKLVATIDRSAERMTRMISDVLDFALGHLGGGSRRRRRRPTSGKYAERRWTKSSWRIPDKPSSSRCRATCAARGIETACIKRYRT